MSSGMREILINLRERALSDDTNRLQRFKSQDVGELFRYMLDVTGSDDLDAGSVVVEHTTLENPLRAEVINGLLVRPIAATLSLTVDPGVLYAVAPDGDADASAYKYVRDAGIPSAGTLALTANSSGSTRFDVVECSIDPVPATVNATRDVFSVTTGTFTPTLVTKEVSGHLAYRVRLGTPGGGFPGTVAGWLPLAVVVSNTGALVTGDYTMWDVRPLTSDRQLAPSALSSSVPVAWAGKALASYGGGTGGGRFDSILNGRRVGGRLRSGNDNPPLTADTETFSYTSAENRENGYAAAANSRWFLYLCTPYGLPRWAKYSTTAPRLPRSPRGIPMVSAVAPDADGRPSTGIPLPAPHAGHLVATSEAVCVASGFVDPFGAFSGFFGDDDGMFYNVGEFTPPTQFTDGTQGIPGINGTVTATPGNASVQFSFVPGTHYPAHARWVFVDFAAFFEADPAVSTYGTIDGFVQGGFTRFRVGNFFAVAGVDAAVLAVGAWFPVPTVYPSSTPPGSTVLGFSVTMGTASTPAGGAYLGRIIGYRF